jgi:hypothetical protein
MVSLLKCDNYSVPYTKSFIGRRAAADNDRNLLVVAYDDAMMGDNSRSAKMQFMITNKMKSKLINELGYLEEEVEDMQPQVANLLQCSCFHILTSAVYL